MPLQVLACTLEAAVLRTDSSALAKDCRAEIKAANARLLKLGRKVLCSPTADRALVDKLCCQLLLQWDLKLLFECLMVQLL